jgi:uncharacterized membrane protein YcaP (DUF421 family)
MFWDSGIALLKIAAVGIPMYFIMVAALRVTGKRALAKMNAYDLVITVSLGSVLASTFLQKDTRLSDGVVALAIMLGLQRLVSYVIERWPWMQQLVLEEPRLLLYDGHMMKNALKKERITEAELLSAIRSHGHMSIRDVQAVVLEPDGTFSAIPKQREVDASAMRTVAGFPRSLSKERLNTGKKGGSGQEGKPQRAGPTG